MNLTDEQKDLLRLLVSQHELHQQAEFLLVRSQTGAGLVYPGGGPSVSVAHDDSDFQQLRGENLITLTHVKANVHRGKPTQRGIDIVRDGFGCSADEPIQQAAAPVVQEWEAFKTAERIESGSRERIPESVLRTILSRQHGVKPDDVTQEQIQQAGTDLCLHYGSVLVIPSETEATDPPKPEPESMAPPQFWKEREDEFRYYDSPENRTLPAVWSSIGGEWVFRAGSGLEFPAPGSEQIFKALAREAAKGLAGSRSTEPSQDWLDALRRKTDKSTGRRLYSKVSTTGRKTIGETWLERMAKFGEPVPPRAMIEFVAWKGRNNGADQSNSPGIPSDSVTTERRLFWDVTTETIEHLFMSSVNLCLELRSLAPRPEPNAGGVAQLGAISPQGITEGAMADMRFWKIRQSDFEKYAKKCPDLEAHWDAVSEGWWLSKADGKEPLVDCGLGFKAEACKAAAGLSGITPNFELWESWLIAMRLCCSDGKPRRWRFIPTRIDRCNELEWEAMQGGRTLAQVRREQGRHPFGYHPDEWKDFSPSRQEVPGPRQMELEKFLSRATADLTDFERTQLGELETAALAEQELKYKASDDRRATTFRTASFIASKAETSPVSLSLRPISVRSWRRASNWKL